MVVFIRDAAPSRSADPTLRVIPAADYALWQESSGLIDAARGEAESIRESAREAFESERRRGYAEGLAAAQLDAAEKMIANVGSTIDYFEKVEERMTQLVMQCMRRVVADFDDQKRVVTVVRSALAAVRNQKQITLKVAPDRVEMVKAATDDLLAAYPGIGYLDLVADSRLHDDACIVETEIGVVEASIEGQIAALGRAFTRILGSRK
ncbi:MAG: HrpE/YscL family type III secretion apparatus protein [Gammaproteobacteria bacterium]